MEKRVVFRSAWLPYALLAPQIAVTLIFFFWPAAQAFWFSLQIQDAFGINTEFVGLRNFADLLRDEHYLESFKTTAVFSVLVGVPTFRLRGTYFAIGTLALAEVLHITVANTNPLITTLPADMIATWSNKRSSPATGVGNFKVIL